MPKQINYLTTSTKFFFYAIIQDIYAGKADRYSVWVINLANEEAATIGREVPMQQAIALVNQDAGSAIL